MSLLEYTRQCDGCNNFVPCEMTYFTERMWFCEGCEKKDVIDDVIDGFKISINNVEREISVYKNALDKDILINIIASKEELIDISRAIGMALVVGEVDTEIDNKRIIIKVKK